MLGSGPLLRRRGKKVDLTVQNVRENQVQALVPRKMQAILCLSYLRVFSFCVSLLFLSPVYFWSFRPRSSPSYIYAFSPLPLPPFYGVIHLDIEPILLNLGWRSMPSRKSHKEHTPWSWPWSLGTELFDSFTPASPARSTCYRRLLHQEIWGVDMGKDDFAG